jgi:hypothetical protein
MSTTNWTASLSLAKWGRNPYPMEPSSKVEPFRNNGNFQKDVISTKPNNTYLLVDYKIAKKIICEIKTSRYYYSFFFLFK